MILAVQLLRHFAEAMRLEAHKYAEGTEEYETYFDAADALDDAADLTESLNG